MDYHKILKEIEHECRHCNTYIVDLSDLGNIIGIILYKYIDKDKLGFELEDFQAGLRHGISLMDGSHNKSSVFEEDIEALKKVDKNILTNEITDFTSKGIIFYG